MPGTKQPKSVHGFLPRRFRAMETPRSRVRASGHQLRRQHPARRAPDHPVQPPRSRSAGSTHRGRLAESRACTSLPAHAPAGGGGPGRAGARGCSGTRRRAGRGKGECLLAATGRSFGCYRRYLCRRRGRGVRGSSALRTSPLFPPVLRASAPGGLTALTCAEAGVASACGAAGTAPAPIPLPDPFFLPPQSWGTRQPPRKAARWRAVSLGPGPGTLRTGRRGAPSAPLGWCLEAAGMVQASQPRSGAA